MEDGLLAAGDAAALARQADDLLDRAAQVQVIPAPTQESTVSGTPGWTIRDMDPGRGLTTRIWEIAVRAGSAGHATLRLDAAWQPVEALGNLIADLHEVCGGKFEGRWFPECPGHDHAAEIAAAADAVIIRCPVSNATVATVRPDLNYLR